MSSPSLLDKVYHAILTRMMKSGQAPHFTEVAGELNIPVEEARKAFTTWRPQEFREFGYFLTPTISAVSPRSVISPPNIASRWMASKSGLANEVLNRWQFAGFSRGRQSRLTPRASIAVYRFRLKSRMGG